VLERSRFSYNLPVACSIAARPQRARDGPAHLMDCFSVWLFSVSFFRGFFLDGFFVGSRIPVFRTIILDEISHNTLGLRASKESDKLSCLSSL
jgi:hypothetical protein